MKIAFSFTVPDWLVPKWLRADLASRCHLTGTASRSRTYGEGIVSTQVVVTQTRQQRGGRND